FSGNYDTFQAMLTGHNREAVAHFTQWGAGYGHFLQGKVVDMFYFPLIEARLPDGIPFLGGRTLIFFEPVFNLADAAISVGVLSLLVFQKSMLHRNTHPDQPNNTHTNTPPTDEPTDKTAVPQI
ncbi:MAG: hypothetical protein EBZ77_07420, partial [Chitinophagia bacterium]|nr:hypothetical protein [Chitinophagia bacterium]